MAEWTKKATEDAISRGHIRTVDGQMLINAAKNIRFS